jgi:hypothetical protein
MIVARKYKALCPVSSMSFQNITSTFIFYDLHKD